MKIMVTGPPHLFPWATLESLLDLFPITHSPQSPSSCLGSTFCAQRKSGKPCLCLCCPHPTGSLLFTSNLSAMSQCNLNSPACPTHSAQAPIKTHPICTISNLSTQPGPGHLAPGSSLVNQPDLQFRSPSSMPRSSLESTYSAPTSYRQPSFCHT